MNETKELILDNLAKIANMVPQQRMGQIIYNYICRYCPGADCFYIEDDKVLAILDQIVEEMSKN